MAKKRDRTGQITVRLGQARALPAAVRQRLHLSDDCTDRVEVYRYHRPDHDSFIRDETARRMHALVSPTHSPSNHHTDT